MASAYSVLIAIASASQQVINALVAYERENTNISRIRLAGRLHRIVAASRTLLNETLRSEDPPFKDSVIDDRLTRWLASSEPQVCLDSLRAMEKVIKSSSSRIASTFRSPFCFVSEDKIKDAFQILEKRKDCFYFLLTIDVWDYETAVKGPSGVNLVVTPSSKARIGLVNKGKNAPERTIAADLTLESGQARYKEDRTQLHEILTWLNGWDCISKHEDTLALRQSDTCVWLPDTTEYITWRNTDDSFLWLNGKPGSGKSVLAASVIDGLENALGDDELLAFFYCDFRSEHSTSSAEVMRSLLSQLLRGFGDLSVDPGDILSCLSKEKHRNGTILASAKRLAAFVSRAANQIAQQPLMVIDALDECNDIENLLDCLVSLTKGGIRLFVVSRPLQVIKDSFSGLRRLSLESMSDEVSADIHLHVTKEVDSHRRFRIVDPALREEIIHTLCEKADGMFRWIECQLATLKRRLTVASIREALGSLPIGLEATYERIFLGMNEEDDKGLLAQRALVWLVAALRPLKLREIVEALSIDIDRSVLDYGIGPVHGHALLDTLLSLVIHDEETDVVILSHFSVKEYLVGKSTKKKWLYHVGEQDAHGQLATECMSYIAACLKLEDGTSEELHPLLSYALSDGFEHLAHVVPTKVVLGAVVNLDQDIQRHSSKWKLLTSHYPYSRLPSLEHDFVLYILIQYASESLLRLFLGRSSIRVKEGTNPLIYVSVWQNINHARILLSCGAKLHCPGRFIRDYTFGPASGLPIEAAVYDGNRELVDLFIAEGSPVPHRLFSVAILDPDISISPHVVAGLTRTDEFMEWATGIGDKTLLRAVDREWYHEDHTPRGDDLLVMTCRLKQIGCDLSAHNSFIEDLLLQAVSMGHVATIEYFRTEFGVSLPPNVLFHLPLRGCSSAPVTCYLLRNGADIHFVSSDEDTVLHHFIEQCGLEDDCLETTKILCEGGCDPSACNLGGDSPIRTAAERGFISVAKYLLSIGTPLPSDILLCLAPPLGSWDPKPFLTIPRFLLAGGADVNVATPSGDTLLHLALCPSLPGIGNPKYLESARILVAAGCNPTVPNSHGQTPVEAAVDCGHLPAVKYLLSLNTAMPLPPSVSHLAASSLLETFPIIKIFLAQGVAYVTTPDGHKALHRAVVAVTHWDDSRCLQVAKILADSGCAQPYTCNRPDETLFHTVVRHRCRKVLETLFSGRVPLPSDILLAPHYADEDLEIIQLLIKKGADVRATGANGDTPLHRAIRVSGPESVLEFVKILISAGADPGAVDSSLRTAMRIAVDQGRLSVIDYLLSLHVPLPPNILLTAIAIRYRTTITPIVRFLIDKGADPRVVTLTGDNPLHLALTNTGERDCLETTKLLISVGCDIHAHNSAGETPLFVATKTGHVAIVAYLLSQLEDEPLPSNIWLAVASCTHLPKLKSTVRTLLDKGLGLANVHAVASNGDTVLHRAAASNHTGLLRVFLDKGCDPSLRNLAGETPLHIAAGKCHIPAVNFFLSKGVPLPSDVLLSVAMGDEFGASSMIRLLVREGADLEAINANGDTPLHVTLRRDFRPWLDEGRQWETIQALLNSGCNPYTRNRDGQTPVDLAGAKGPFCLRNFMRLVKNAQNAPKPN